MISEAFPGSCSYSSSWAESACVAEEPGKQSPSPWAVFPQLTLGREGTGVRRSVLGWGKSGWWCSGGRGRGGHGMQGTKCDEDFLWESHVWSQSRSSASFLALLLHRLSWLLQTWQNSGCLQPSPTYFESCCILLRFIPVNVYKENEIFTAVIRAGLRSVIKNLYWFSPLLNYYIKRL